MSKRLELAGKVFGRLTVIEPARKDRSGKVRWRCICDCGVEKEVLSSSLSLKHTRSCGCLRNDLSKSRNKTHGDSCGGSTTPEYNSRSQILQRCTDENNKAYPEYGGRGIQVCSRWKESFENFLEDMGRKPSPQHSIERIDNDGNYCPENCRWATKKEQARNRRSNRMIRLNGRTQCLADWVDELGISRSTVKDRLRRGWSEEKALTTPVRKKIKV